MFMKNKMFTLEEVFDIYKGKRLTKADMIDGNTNYIGAISDDNGIREKIGQVPIFKPNCITVNYNGSVGEAFYQIKPFWASDDVNVLYLKNKDLTKNIALYLITVIKANKYRFSYGRKWTLEKMKKTEIPLPVTMEGLIDWEYIENYISNLHNKPITSKNKNINQKLNFVGWSEFKLSDIFIIKKSKNINFIDVTQGNDLNYISRTTNNNGLQCRIKDNDFNKCKAKCISIGGESASIFYQDKEFITGNNITLLYNKNLNKYNGLFIVSVLSKERYKYSYGRAFNKEHIENTLILLPTKNNLPDWEFMEEYIKAFPNADRI